jgi:hypothetical protein
MTSLSASERERAWIAFSTYAVVKTGGHVEETAIYERVSQVLQTRGHEGFSSAEEMCEDFFKKWGLPDWAFPADM